MSTKTNLNEHIRWLLQKNTVLPTYATPPPTAFGSSPNGTDPFEAYTTADEHNVFDENTQRSHDLDHMSTYRQHSKSAISQGDTISDTMARLAPASGSSRKRILVQNSTQDIPRKLDNIDGERDRFRAKLGSRSDNGYIVTPTSVLARQHVSARNERCGTPVHTSSPSTRSLDQKESSSFEDFTEPLPLWTEKHASQKEPSPKRGKKRKSDEMSKSSKAKKTPVRPALLDDGGDFGFTPIDELDLRQLEEEEVITATPSKSKRSRSSETSEGHANDIMIEGLEMLDTMPRTVLAANESRTLRGDNRVPLLSSPKSHGLLRAQSHLRSPTRSPGRSIQQKTRTARRSLESHSRDSGEEELVGLIRHSKAPEEEQSGWQISSSQTQVKRMAASQRGATHEPTSRQANLGSQAPSLSVNNGVDYPQLAVAASPYHSDSPTRVNIPLPSSRPSREAIPATPAPQRDWSVDTFLKLQRRPLEQHLSGLEQQMNEKLDAMWLSGEAGEADDTAQCEAETLRDEVAGFEKLMALYDEHQSLAGRAFALQKSFKQAFRERRAVNSRDYQLLPQERERMKEIEQDLVEHIDRCRLVLKSRLSEELLHVGQVSSENIYRTTNSQGIRNTDPVTHIPLSPSKKPITHTSKMQSFDEVPSTPSRTEGRSRQLGSLVTSAPQFSGEQARTPLRELRFTEQGRNGAEPCSPRYQSTKLSRTTTMQYEDVENDMDFQQHMGSPVRPAHFHAQDDMSPADNGFVMDDDEEMLDYLADLEQRSDRSPTKHIATAVTGDQRAFEMSSLTQTAKMQSKTMKSAKGTQSLMSFQWSKDVKTALVHRFGLQGFRHNQLEAINATLSGKDTFVLMPTGGGKSLCYQLPAVVNSGRSRGVTIVVSPLLSLMQDQVQHLRDINVQASLINGETAPEAKSTIMEALRGSDPGRFIQLLYVTPEMLSKNKSMINLFKSLNSRRQIARIVVDEAHCVSQWGHDFRPDYKCIGEFRRELPGVPLMALTATATENVKMDVIQNLGMSACEIFTQSFNRPNLFYEVYKKGSGTLDAIAKLIKDRHHRQCGIIYCLSRKTCEKTAEQLREKHGILAQHYHAGMEPEEKASAQTRWQAGSCHVIVATIAFGMGIDKPNVRYVIHHSVPKSLEGYYQETGRAGRDGKPSRCYLFYLFKDVTTIDRMIREDTNSNQDQKNRQLAMLREVNRFCDNRADCRRVQILSYFNERFTVDECNKTCDNCNSNSSFEKRDMSMLAKAAIDLVKVISEQNFTKHQCVDILRGSGAKNSRRQEAEDLGAPCIGSAKGQDRGTVERLFNLLITDGALRETHVVKMDFPIAYLALGDRWREFASGTRKVYLDVSQSPNPGRKKKTADLDNGFGGQYEVDSTRTRSKPVKKHPTSTMLSSPSNHRGPQLAKLRRVDETSGRSAPVSKPLPASQESDSEFEPIRDVRRSKLPRRTPDLGPPIIEDPVLADLDEAHRAVIEQALEGLTTRAREVMGRKGLRRQPFTDTQLRTMLIDFPTTEDEMLKITGIRGDAVREHGRHFFNLIQDARGVLEAMRGGFNEVADSSADDDVFEDDDNDDEKVHDKNHDLSVIVIDSDEDAASYAGEYDLDADTTGQVSEYFRPPPDVEAFNARMSQAMPGPAASTTSREANKSRRTSQSTRSTAGYRKASFGRFKPGSKSGKQKNASARGSKSANNSSRPLQKAGPKSAAKKSDTKSRGRLDGYMNTSGIGMMPT